METVKGILVSLLLLLPESPVQGWLEEYVNVGEFTFLNYLNWFIPFDIISKIMGVWVGYILLYRLYRMVKQKFSKLL